MISTRHLADLPTPAHLRLQLQEMAALEAVYAIDSNEADYVFYPKWAKDEQLATIKDGSGDELFAHFTTAGCFIKGFAHESSMTPYRTTPPTLWPRLLDNVPDEFRCSLNEPALDIPHTTFVVWRLSSDDAWHTSDVEYPDETDPDGSNDLLSRITLPAEGFAEWLADHYEVEVDATIVAHVFEHGTLSNKQLQLLNRGASLPSIRKAVELTGYPLI